MTLTLMLSSVIVLAVLLLRAGRAQAHCDTLEGPVVKAALKAFEKGDVTPVLMWIQPQDEAEVKKAFDLALKVRALGPEARELAERSFFETLIRIHRAGEGAPYEGLKPGSSVPPVVGKADAALESGDISELSERIPGHVRKAIDERFHAALEKKKTAGDSPEKGREYVEAYISFVHYVEGIHALTMGGGHHHGH